jgi:hypothetical protein
MVSKYSIVEVNTYAVTKSAVVVLKIIYWIIGEMKRAVSLFGESTKCRAYLFSDRYSKPHEPCFDYEYLLFTWTHTLNVI